MSPRERDKNRGSFVVSLCASYAFTSQLSDMSAWTIKNAFGCSVFLQPKASSCVSFFDSIRQRHKAGFPAASVTDSLLQVQMPEYITASKAIKFCSVIPQIIFLV